jgi:diacylglycerol kinase (ATP)
VRRALAITGPRSSAKHAAPFQRASGDAALVHLLDHPEYEEVRQELASKPDCVLLFGGDGTLNRYLQLLLEAQIPLLIVPTGSGNDFAMANGVDRAADALAVFTDWLANKATTCHCDIASLIVADESGNRQKKYFSCCVNVGLDADAVLHANRLPNWLKARGGYVIGSLQAMLSFQPQQYEITTSGESQTKTLWFIAALNTPTYGGGLKIAPHATIIDQKLELASCGAVSRLALLRHLPRLASGNVQNITFLGWQSVHNFSVTTTTPQPVAADGELMGFTPIDVSLAAESLPVLRRISV